MAVAPYRRCRLFLGLCYLSFLHFAKNDSCSSADGTTTVSVNCDNFYLDWMSDYDISEVYLFAQCKKFNDSQSSRLQSTVIAIPQTSSLHYPLSSHFVPLPGERCHYYGCVLEEYDLEVYTFPTVTCAKPTVDLDAIAPVSTSTEWSVPASSVSLHNELTSSYLPLELSEDYSSRDTRRSWPAKESAGEDVLPTSSIADLEPLPMETIESTSQNTIFELDTPQTLYPGNLSSLLPVLAPVLGLLAVICVSLLASLGICYLVKAYKDVGIREKRVLGYYWPMNLDTIENMDHLHLHLPQPQHRSSTSSIVTVLTPMMDSQDASKTSSTAEILSPANLDHPIPWSQNFVGAQECDSSGCSSAQTWNGYVSIQNMPPRVSQNSWNSSQNQSLDALQDYRTERFSLDSSRYYHACSVQDERIILATDEVSDIWSPLPEAEMEHLKAMELSEESPEVAADEISKRFRVHGHTLVEEGGALNLGCGCLDEARHRQDSTLSKYVVDCTKLGSCDQDSINSSNLGDGSLTDDAWHSPEALEEDKQFYSSIQYSNMNVKMFCTPI